MLEANIDERPAAAREDVFRGAGIELAYTPRERVERMMREAIGLCGGVSAGAVSDYFRDALSRDDDPEAVLWALFDPFFNIAFRVLFTEMLNKMRQHGARDAAAEAMGFVLQGHPKHAEAAAPNVVPGEANNGVPKGQSRPADPGTAPHAGGAAKSDVPRGHQEAATPPAPQESEWVRRLRLNATNRVAAMQSAAYREFDAIRFNGMSLLDQTAEAALAWAEGAGRNIKRVRALCSLIPNPGRKIREQMTEETAKEALRLAENMP